LTPGLSKPVTPTHETCTRVHGYGFSRVRVRVQLEIPGGYPCHSLSMIVSSWRMPGRHNNCSFMKQQTSKMRTSKRLLASASDLSKISKRHPFQQTRRTGRPQSSNFFVIVSTIEHSFSAQKASNASDSDLPGTGILSDNLSTDAINAACG